MDTSKRRQANEALATAKSSSTSEEYAALLKTLSQILSNVLQKPGDTRVRTLKYDNKTFKSKVAARPGAVDFLKCIGFEDAKEKIDDGKKKQKVLQLLSKNEDPSVISAGLALVNEEVSGANSSQPSAAGATPSDGFDPFSANMIRVAPQPRGKKSKTDSKVDTLKKKRESMIQQAGIPERQVCIVPPGVKVPTVGSASASAAGNSKEELRLVQQAAAIRAKKQRDSMQFRTKNMRELEALEQSKVYTEITIRIQFPDRLSFRASFAPFETIHSIKQVLKAHLVDPLSSAAMVLFTTPPRTVLNDDDTLEAAGLYPAAQVFVSWPDVDYLALYPKFVSLMPVYASKVAAGEIYTQVPGTETHYTTSAPLVPAAKQKASADLGIGASSASSKSKSSTKVPKWFKR